MIAFVFEDLCIGCTKCIKRCPTDAIVGASKQIHGVVDDACTGCEACADVCPTGAITMRAETPDPANMALAETRAAISLLTD